MAELEQSQETGELTRRRRRRRTSRAGGVSEDGPQAKPLLQLICPNCRSTQMTRVKREGWFRGRVLSFFGYYPWSCFGCRKVSMMRLRGYRRLRTPGDSTNDSSGD